MSITASGIADALAVRAPRIRLADRSELERIVRIADLLGLIVNG
nr:hypothetical protein [Bradyrhizobium sp. ORS 278]